MYTAAARINSVSITIMATIIHVTCGSSWSDPGLPVSSTGNAEKYTVQRQYTLVKHIINEHHNNN